MPVRRPLIRSAALALLAGLSLAAVAQAAPTTAPLQQRMSYAEFRKAGLDHLSPEQLKELNHWLAAHGCQGGAMADTQPDAAAPRRHHGDRTIHSRLKGDFHGWENGTVLTLQNGQRWQVADDTEMHIATIHQPQVTVSRGFLGTWILSIKGISDIVHVVPAD